MLGSLATASALLQAQRFAVDRYGGGGGGFPWSELLRVLLAVAAAALLFTAFRIVRRWRRERRSEVLHELPPLLFEPRPPTGRAAMSLEEWLPRPDPPVPPASTAASDTAPSSNGAAAAGSSAEPVEYDGTLQLLPGRLEPVNGTSGEIRFVRLPVGNRFTIGRSPGPPLTHIQLNVPTLSRMHAYLEHTEGRWRIGNLSATNCVVVNGRALEGDGSQWLAEGDQVELGQLVFVYHSR